MSRYMGTVLLDDTVVRSGHKIYLESAGGGRVSIEADATTSSNLTFKYPPDGGITNQGLGSLDGSGILSFFHYALQGGQGAGYNSQLNLGTNTENNVSLFANNGSTQLILNTAGNKLIDVFCGTNGIDGLNHGAGMKFWDTPAAGWLVLGVASGMIDTYHLRLPSVYPAKEKSSLVITTDAPSVGTNNYVDAVWDYPLSVYYPITYNVDTTLSGPYNLIQVDTNVNSADITITLPSVNTAHLFTYQIVKVDSGAFNVFVIPQTGEMINGIVDKVITLPAQFARVGLIPLTGYSWMIS